MLRTSPRNDAGAAGEPEALRERVVELRQLPLFDRLGVDRELGSLAGQALRRIVLREQDRRRRAFRGFEPAKRRVEVLQDLPGADDDPDTLALPALERLAVDGAGEVDRDAIAIGGSALDGRPSRALAAQLLDHRVEIGLLDLDARHVDREVAERLAA